MSYKPSDDEREEFRERKPKYIGCSDRMCGALDCPRCHPENFKGGVYWEDVERDEDEKGRSQDE
jgi:hypothetical protein